MTIAKINSAGNAEAPHQAKKAANERDAPSAAALRDSGSTGRLSADSVRFSGRAQEAGELVARLADLPDVRADRVEHFRNRIESGSYRPSADDIADAILQSERQS